MTGASVATPVDVPVIVPLDARDPDGNPLTLRIVSQPSHGSTGLNGTLATYIPEPGFTGIDRFTFAAWDGSTDSNLGNVNITCFVPDSPESVRLALARESTVPR